ncbi:MAG: energy-coupled thiamine transporter ThiT, partial [Christensenellales bacterium]
MDLKNFKSLSIFDKSATIAFFVTIFFAIVIIAILAVCKKRNTTDKVRPYVGGFVFGYSLSVILLLGFLKLDEYSAAGYIEKNSFYPVLAFVLTILVLAVAAIIVLLFKREKFPLFAKIASGIVIAFAVALIIAMGVINNSMTLSAADNAMLYIFTIIIVAAIVLLAIFCGKKEDARLHTKSIVYASLSIALSFALSYVRFFEMPSGGSITLASILPLMIYSYMFGIRRGIVAGVIYGFLQFIQAPWLYHPVQFLLDYPIAFSAIG